MSRVLVVDDEAANIAVLVDILRAEHEVFVARSGEQALDRLASGLLPDVILLDLRMPGMDGYEVCARLKEESKTSGIPVIFVTALADAENEERGLSLGAVDYIIRPFTPAIVRARVRNHLELARARRESDGRYRALFANVADGVSIQNLDGDIIEVNEAFCRNTGYSRRELFAKKASELESAEDRRRYDERVLEAQQRGRSTFETTQVRKDGTTFPVEVHLRPIELAGEAAVLAVCRDITERKAAESELTRYRDHLEDLVQQRTVELRNKDRELAELQGDLRRSWSYQNMVGKSEPMQSLFARVQTLADLDTTVVISGESGTGKELVCEALHFGGVHRDRPFVKVVCSELPESLIESELFGHVRGAFTGAVQARRGRFEKAGKGTLFLDEIGDISQKFQKRLLRVIERRCFERVGESNPIPMRARVVAATHRDLAELVHKGLFREDLYYRLKVVELKLPPLRERIEDIPLLARYFLPMLRENTGKEIDDISSEALELLMAHDWPGNVRELKHSLEYACVSCGGRAITVSDLPAELRESTPRNFGMQQSAPSDEAHALQRALEQTRWNKTRAARLLGVSRQTLYRKLHEHHLLTDE